MYRFNKLLDFQRAFYETSYANSKIHVNDYMDKSSWEYPKFKEQERKGKRNEKEEEKRREWN